MGNYIDEVFAQLDFGLGLCHHVDMRKIDPDEFNTPLTYQDPGIVFTCNEEYFTSQERLKTAVWISVGISFGAAAITLNRLRKESSHPLPAPIPAEADQLIGLIYQIGNAFAHNVSEPIWKIKERYQREYRIGSSQAELSSLDGCPLHFSQFAGPGILKDLYDYGRSNLGLF